MEQTLIASKKNGNANENKQAQEVFAHGLSSMVYRGHPDLLDITNARYGMLQARRCTKLLIKTSARGVTGLA